MLCRYYKQWASALAWYVVKWFCHVVTIKSFTHIQPVVTCSFYKVHVRENDEERTRSSAAHHRRIGDCHRVLCNVVVPRGWLDARAGLAIDGTSWIVL